MPVDLLPSAAVTIGGKSLEETRGIFDRCRGR